MLMLAGIWIGCVSAISFMEAWLKFQAPNVTLAVGLSIGKLIFYGLNKVEWVFASLIMALFLLEKLPMKSALYFYIPCSLLTLQTFWLQPALGRRVDSILEGKALAPSFLHVYYLSMEGIKVLCLCLFCVGLFARCFRFSSLTK